MAKKNGEGATLKDSSFFSAIDLVPTVLDVAQLPIPDAIEFDGEALSAVLTGTSTASRKHPLFFRRPPDRDAYYGVADLPDLAVREGKWKLLCEYDGSQPELYDLERDRQEHNNVAAEHPKVVTHLTQAVVSWHEAMPQDHGATFKK